MQQNCSSSTEKFQNFPEKAVRKVSRLVRVHTDSHHNGHSKMIFAVSDV